MPSSRRPIMTKSTATVLPPTLALETCEICRTPGSRLAATSAPRSAGCRAGIGQAHLAETKRPGFGMRAIASVSPLVVRQERIRHVEDHIGPVLGSERVRDLV